MYKVLLVDDERIILEGISAIVDWRACGVTLAGTARNGLEAKAFIERERPDIVITDIRMPGMDGLQLVELVKESDPDIGFIMLSGFGDFEYARRAMRYGVKHYLLKPCNERAIAAALGELAGELARKKDRERFVRCTEAELQRVLPHAREQLLKELVTNKTYGRRDWDRFRRLFGIPFEAGRVRLLLCRPEGEFEFEHLFALQNIAGDVLRDRLLLGTALGRHVLLLLRESGDVGELYELIGEVKRTFARYYKLDATAALSEPDDITAARRLYRDTLECFAHRFYLGEGSLITMADIRPSDAPGPDEFLYDEERLCLHVKAGRWVDVERELNHIFDALAALRLDTATTKAYVIPLYAACVRQGEPARIGSRLQAVAPLAGAETLQALRALVLAAVKEICEANYERHRSQHSALVARMLACIDEHLGSPELSLHRVARDMMFMNPDYLGKLFRREIGEKFSRYVTRLRMEKAAEWIAQADDVRIYELAERLGYGGNPQYFSQVFKKHTGYTPSEYKRTLG